MASGYLRVGICSAQMYEMTPESHSRNTGIHYGFKSVEHNLDMQDKNSSCYVWKYSH